MHARSPKFGDGNKRTPGTHWPARLGRLESCGFSEGPFSEGKVKKAWKRHLILTMGAQVCIPTNTYHIHARRDTYKTDPNYLQMLMLLLEC